MSLLGMSGGRVSTLIPTAPLCTAMPTPFVDGWPKYDTCKYAQWTGTNPLGDVLSLDCKSDVHFTQYVSPNERRLDQGAPEKLPDGVPMVLAVFDIDADHAHAATGGTPGLDAGDVWWIDQLDHIDQLRAEHPKLYTYRTRGGYRIVGVLPAPFVVRDDATAKQWTKTYLAWTAYLLRRFEIVADPCSDWQRLFRAPHAARDNSGQPERRETIGDPHAIGLWAPQLTEDDHANAVKLSRRKPKKKKDRKRVGPVYQGNGILYSALLARGAIGHELEPRKWAVVCPLAEQHSKGSNFDSSTFLAGPRDGEVFGWIHCSHTNSRHKYFSLRDWLAHFSDDEIRDARAAAGVPDPRVDERPEVVLGADVHRVVDELVAALAGDRELYQRDGQLVRCVRVATPEQSEHDGVSIGTPMIREVETPTLRERITRLVRCMGFDARTGDYAEKIPSQDVVAAVAQRVEWPGVAPIVGIIETPTLRPDGSILDTPGHDPATGYIYAPTRTYPAIPASPTIDDARAALGALTEPFRQFPFQAHVEIAVPIAAVLTMIARPAIRGAVPGFVFDASTRGSGKTLLARAVSMLAHGRECALMSWPGDEIELEKVLGSYARQGANVIAFDNLTQRFGGGPIDKVLTCADRVELRVLGVSEIPALAWRAVILAGGNNFELAPDTSRRVLLARIEPPVENPEERTGWAIPDLVAWCDEHHARIVVEALTMLRAYVLAGRPQRFVLDTCGLWQPKPMRPWGSYEAWSGLVASAIHWASDGTVDPMGCRPTVRGDEDDSTAALRALIEVWGRFAPKGISAAGALNRLYTSAGLPAPDEWGQLRDAIETMSPPRQGQRTPDAGRLGRELAKARRRIIGSKFLDTVKVHGVRVWSVQEVRRDR